MDYVNLIIALILFSVAVSASCTGINEMKRYLENELFGRLCRSVRRYIKDASKTSYKSFVIGYQDGRSGNDPKMPELPPMDNPKVYALCLLSQELYKDGYEAGAAVRRTTDECV